MKTALETMIEQEGMLSDCLDTINELVGIIGHAELPDRDITDGLGRIDCAHAKHQQRVQADIDQQQVLNLDRRIKM